MFNIMLFIYNGDIVFGTDSVSIGVGVHFLVCVITL